MKNDELAPQIEGDRNLIIGKNSGNAFGNVEGNVNVILNASSSKAQSQYELRRDIGDEFTGRHDEIKRILEHLKGEGTGKIAAISGMPGVGKSALAIHVAHQLAVSDFPDVQLCIDLRGDDGNALEPADVLAQFLRALGLEESWIPNDLRERSSVYRSQLWGKRAIVVLDNARDEVQMRPLLPGSATCAVIVTSRRVLGALEGTMDIPLPVLPEPEAVELLGRLIDPQRVEPERAKAEEIVKLCGQLPLAIRIVGGTLKVKRHWTLKDYAQRLADEKQRLNHLQLSNLDVRASFELSYRELSAADKNLFYRLSVLENKDFSKDIADVLVEENVESLKAIERLLDSQLLESKNNKRCQFHDLVHIFAQEKLLESTTFEQREGLKRQLVGWGKSWSFIWDRCLNPIPHREMIQQWIENGYISPEIDEQHLPREALYWFDQERENLLNILDWASISERWYEVVSIAEALVDFFKIRSHWKDWQQTCQLAIKAARKSGNLYGEGLALNNLGNVLMMQSQWDKSVEVYLQSLDICGYLYNYNNCRDNLKQLTLNNLGLVYRLQSRWDEAVNYFQKSLKICKELGDKSGECLALNNIGTVYQDRGFWTEAISYFDRSLNICDDFHGKGLLLSNLGSTYTKQRLWEKATIHCERSLAIFREFGDRKMEVSVLNNLGVVYMSQHRWDDAMDFLKQSLAVFQEFNYPHGKGQTLNNLGIWYQSQERWDEAEEWHRQSLDIRKAIGDHSGQCETLDNLGSVLCSQNSWVEADACLQESLDIRQSKGDKYGEGQTLYNLGNLSQVQGQWAEAFNWYQQSLEIKRFFGDHYGEGKVLANQGMLFSQQGQLERAIKIWQEALTKIPPEEAVYRTVIEWLADAQAPIPKQKLWFKLLPLILFGNVVLLVVVGVQGNLIFSGIMLIILLIAWLLK